MWECLELLPDLLCDLRSPLTTKLPFFSEYIFLVFFFSNSTGPFCTQVASICLRAKDKKNTRNLASSDSGCARTILSGKFK